ncbi:MAG: hypothetical protein ACRCZJ_08270 [Erysipelotrichaceae bacterium]
MSAWLRMQPHEHLLVISNEDYVFEMELLQHAASRAGCLFSVEIISKLPEVRDMELDFLKHTRYDAIIGATKYSILTNPSIKIAIQQGARFLSMPLQTNDGRSLLASRLFEMNPDDAQALYEHLVAVLYQAHLVEIKTPAGTHLYLDKGAYQPLLFNGECRYPYTASSVAFELACATNSLSTHGDVVVDASFGYLGVCTQPVRLTIAQGKIVAVEQNEMGKKIEAYLKAFDDPLLYNISELGIGLNRFAKCTGASYIEDESAYGTWHLGFGSNVTFGGSIYASAHFDFVMQACDMWADGVQIIANGVVCQRK